MRACLTILVMFLCINGCANVTTDSVVWRAQDVALANYQSLQIQDVFNISGSTISNESLVYCTKRLRKELEGHGLEVVERSPESGNALRVQTSVVYFEFQKPVIGSYNSNSTVKESIVSVQVVMLDQDLNRTVAEIKNVTNYGSGVYKLHDDKKTLFRRIAKITADEIAKVLRPAKTQ